MKRRENGFGTLVKKPNGKYMAKWFYQGKCYYKMTGETDKKKALSTLSKNGRSVKLPLLPNEVNSKIKNKIAGITTKKALATITIFE